MLWASRVTSPQESQGQTWPGRSKAGVEEEANNGLCSRVDKGHTRLGLMLQGVLRYASFKGRSALRGAHEHSV